MTISCVSTAVRHSTRLVRRLHLIPVTRPLATFSCQAFSLVQPNTYTKWTANLATSAPDSSSEAMSNSKLKILVILGSVRDGRQGDRVAKFVLNKLKGTDHEVDFWDPLELDLPMLKQPIHFYPKSENVPQKLLDLHEKVKSADAYIILTAEYNRQMPPALTNTMSYFPPASYGYKTSGIISYSMGPQGAAIAAHTAKGFLVELGCLPVSFNLNIATVHEQFDEDGKTSNDRMNTGFEKLLKQLEWWGEAAKTQREKKAPPS